MAHITANRVLQTTTTTGTGALALSGTPTGFQAFSDAMSDADTCYYALQDDSSGDWEIGVGTYSSNTLTRTTVLNSSNSNSAVNLTAGTKQVFISIPASKTVAVDTSGNLSLSGDLAVDSDTLKIDSANDRVGVNEGTPTASLTVQAAHNTLHVQKIQNAGGNVVQETYVNGDGHGALNIRDGSGVHKMQFSTYENSFIKAGYSFGLGTSSPRYDLAVKGDSSTAVGIALDNDSGSATLDIAALGAAYGAHGAAAGEVWFYSPDNINIGGATGNTNDIKFLGNGAERMRITSAGHVAINRTDTQNAMLMIEQDSTSTAGGIQIGRSDGSATYAISNVGSNLRFGVSSSGNGTVDIDTMTLDYQGLCGLGTASPTQKLTLSGGTSDVAMLFNSTDTAYYNIGIKKDGSQLRFIEYGNDGTTEGANIMVLDANGEKVFINAGTTNSLTNLNIKSEGGGGGLKIYQGDSNPSDGSELGSIAFSGVDSANNNNSSEAKIYAVATEAHSGTNAGTSMVFMTKPNGTGPGSAPTERLRILSSGGITFNGDTSVNNSLSEYEIGTITPTLTPSTSGSITTGNSRTTLQYTKIGNVVHIQGFLEVTAVSSPVGTIQVPTGFTPAGTQSSDITAGTCVVSSSSNSLQVNQYAITANGLHTYLNIVATDGATFAGDTAQSIGSTADIYINITYVVA